MRTLSKSNGSCISTCRSLLGYEGCCAGGIVSLACFFRYGRSDAGKDVKARMMDMQKIANKT